MGILEDVNAKLDAIINFLKAGHTAQAQQQPAPLTTPTLQPVQQYQPDPFAAHPAQQPVHQPQQQVQVTDEMIRSLIQPFLANDQIKAQLQQALAAMGIAGLSAATPEQFPAIYAAFQRTLAPYANSGAGAPILSVGPAAGQAMQQQQPQGGVSII